MNPRVEKSAMVLQLNRDAEGTELWVGMYDLWADYWALLADYNAKGRELAEEQRWSRNYCDDLSSVTAENAGVRGQLAEARRALRFARKCEEDHGRVDWDMVDAIAPEPSEASSAEAQDETSTAQEEIKELEADLRSSEAEENAAWDEADKWQERAEIAQEEIGGLRDALENETGYADVWKSRALYAGNAVRLLIAYARGCQDWAFEEYGLLTSRRLALPKWMREMIEK